MKRFSDFLKIVFFQFILLFIIALISSAQTSDLSFRNITSRDGLSSDNIQCIYQDKDGFLWFGGEGIADRYDGRTFRKYFDKIKDKSENSTQVITGIVEDSYHGMWFINSNNSLILINKASEKIIRFRVDTNNKSSITSNDITSIFEDSRKNLWIITNGGGLNLFNRSDSSFIKFQHDSANIKSIGSNYLNSIAEDHNGMVWISSTDGILIKLNPDRKEFENIKISDLESSSSTVLKSPVIFIDKDNQIWYASRQDVFKYDQTKRKITRFSIVPEGTNTVLFTITSIIDFDNDNLLISTYSNGLYLLNSKTGTYKNYKFSPLDINGLGTNRIFCLFRSKEGVLWIGTRDVGLQIYASNALRFPQLSNLVEPEYIRLSNYSAYCFWEDGDGKIYIGTENNGMVLFDPVNRTLKKILPQLSNYSIFSIIPLEESKIFICTWVNGSYLYDLKSKSVEYVETLPGYKNIALGDRLIKIITDHKKRIWLGYAGDGIAMFDPEKNKFNKYKVNIIKPKVLSINFIYKIVEDHLGNIWVGTGDGLLVFDDVKNSFKKINVKDDYGKEIINTSFTEIFEDSKNRLWACSSYAMHLYNRSTGEFKCYPVKRNDEYLAVQKIIEDENCIFWLGTKSGIVSFDPETGSLRDFGSTDGINYLFNNPSSGLKSKNGFMYFGSIRGTTIFRSEDIIDDTCVPPVFITNIRVNDISLDAFYNDNQKSSVLYRKHIKLKHNQSTLTFFFSALNYLNPENNQFAYQLVGYEKNMIRTQNNIAYYPNLPPGKYAFKVIASNNHGIWNDKGSEVSITISKPLYGKLWFKLINVVLIITIILLIYFQRIFSLRQKKKLLEIIVKERTKELNDLNKKLTEQHVALSQQNEEISTQNELLSQMSEEIIKQNTELERHRTNLEKLVFDRTRELEIAVQKANESDRLKSAFLANMSHEIRTPMNAIVGFANLLKDSDIGPSEKSEFIDIINNNSETLLVLIDDILDLSLIEANQLQIKKEIFSLNELLDNLYSSSSLINKKSDLKIKLNNKLHNLNLNFSTDKVRLRQILSNLINNAYKFTEQGNLEIGAYKKDKNIIIYVEDTGIGISKNELPNLFERFRKSESSINTIYRGAGLGLAISKRLSHLLEGDLIAESEIGKGSVFSLILPYSVITSDSIPLLKTVSGLYDNKLKGKNILIVEDEQTNYLYAKKLLSNLDVNVYWAGNGKEAIKMTSDDKVFAVILMDIKMPVMDGYEATKLIKTNKPSQIVIALTAYARPQDKDHFMSAGFDDYLSKPIKPNDFINAIKKFINK